MAICCSQFIGECYNAPNTVGWGGVEFGKLILVKIITINSSGDEIANVNFLYDEIVHELEKGIDLHKFRHRSFSATQVYQIQ